MAADTAPSTTPAKGIKGGMNKRNKMIAAVAGGGALLYVVTKGHSGSGSATDATSSDPAQGQTVQLVPTADSPAQAVDNGDTSVQQVPDTPLPVDVPTLPDNSPEPLPSPVSIGGDLNAPISGVDPNELITAQASGFAAGAAAAKSATKPPGHPGYGGGGKKPAPKKPAPKPKPKSTAPKAAAPSHPAASPAKEVGLGTGIGAGLAKVAPKKAAPKPAPKPAPKAKAAAAKPAPAPAPAPKAAEPTKGGSK